MADTLKGFSIDTWWGLVAPAGTPRDVVAKLNQAFVAALSAPETKTRFAALLAEPVGNTPEQFGAFMKSELAKYEKVRQGHRREPRSHLKRLLRPRLRSRPEDHSPRYAARTFGSLSITLASPLMVIRPDSIT